MNGFELIGYSILALYYGSLAVICFGIWRLLKHRRWIGSLLLCIFMGVFLFPGLSWGIVPGSSVYLDLKQTKQLTGKAFLLGSAELSHHSDRAFNGDGYSIDVYLISERAADYLMDPAEEFFQRFPILPNYRSDWKSEPWRKTPSRSQDSKYIHFVSLSTENFGGNSNDPRDVASRLLAEQGNYYSYFYNVPSKYLGDVDLFIISPKERLIVIVNHNT